ncbi:MAG: hypothetical protein AAB320_04890 [Elusimicrobiota bacterium]
MATQLKKRVVRKKAAAPAVRRTAKKKIAAKKLATNHISPDEVVVLENQAAQSHKSEQSWLRMTAAPDGDDRWVAVEEKIVAKSQDDKTWKYASK